MEFVLTIAKKEIRSFFDSLIAYILLTAFLGISGFFTWVYGSDIFLINQATLLPFFNVALWTIFFFTPALTMKMFAEEKRTGTLEFLLTKPGEDIQVIAGKFLAVTGLTAISLLLTIPYYITVSTLGPLDHGATISGYIGLLLLSGALTGIGLLASSLTNNQIVAYLAAIFTGLFFMIITGVISQNTTGSLSVIFNFLNLQFHYDAVSRGVIDSRNIIFFVSLTVVSLYLTSLNLSSRFIKS
ncbi:MAG: ABC transporter permease subunit [Ignavibacteriaceae bacterium]|nr:ABC transporter permease subunit [Ignavibacteriaceae bacterium]